MNVREKILLLKKHLPDWKFLDDLLIDSEAMLELAQIVRLQDEWLKHRASSLYIDPLLIQLKIKVLSKDELSEAFVKSWHPLVQIDQISPKGLEKAFVYWRDLQPLSERFKDQFGNYGAATGTISMEDLVGLKVFTQEQFEAKLKELHQDLMKESDGDWIDYRKFVRGGSYEERVAKSYLLSFLISEGKASLKSDPLTGEVWTKALSEKAGGTPKSVAISVEAGP